MPTNLHLALRAEGAGVPRPVSPAQLHGLACSILEGVGAEHRAPVKPFSVSPLLEAVGAPGLALLRLGWLDDERVPDLWPHVGATRRAGSQFFVVEDVVEDHRPYAVLAAGEPARRVAFAFVTTTYFTRGDRQYPLPDPEMLLRGLSRRWNAFAPVPLAPGVVEDLCTQVRIAEYETESAMVDLGAGRGGERSSIRTGFRGRATFVLPATAGTSETTAFAALSRFAELAGVGAQTTRGLGDVRVAFIPVRGDGHQRRSHSPAERADLLRNSNPRERAGEADLRARYPRRSKD